MPNLFTSALQRFIRPSQPLHGKPVPFLPAEEGAAEATLVRPGGPVARTSWRDLPTTKQASEQVTRTPANALTARSVRTAGQGDRPTLSSLQLPSRQRMVMGAAIHKLLAQVPLTSPPRQTYPVKDTLRQNADAEFEAAVRSYYKPAEEYQAKKEVAEFVASQWADPSPQVFRSVRTGRADRISADLLGLVLKQLSAYHQMAIKDPSPEGKRLAAFLAAAMVNAVATAAGGTDALDLARGSPSADGVGRAAR